MQGKGSTYLYGQVCATPWGMDLSAILARNRASSLIILVPNRPWLLQSSLLIGYVLFFF